MTLHLLINLFCCHTALDVRSTSAKEVMRQVSATRFLLANPKIVIEKNLNLSPRPPSVVFTFIDGSDEIFDTQDLVAKEMMDTIWLKTNAMSCEYEMEGKSIDDSM